MFKVHQSTEFKNDALCNAPLHVLGPRAQISIAVAFLCMLQWHKARFRQPYQDGIAAVETTDKSSRLRDQDALDSFESID
jgi:hypothetical protein